MSWVLPLAAMSEPYRKVLLVLISAVPPPRVLDAACALCGRLGAGLEIVALGEGLAPARLAGLAERPGVHACVCRAEAKPDWGVADLVEWANARACVATVVLPEADGEAAESELWRHLACPLVVVGTDPV
ncbi:hypothetical protein EZJ19_00695 [Parasulfuritortus cantonensis]|uniref:Uncharacterized protein n=1 Tax=Parasulfuritortus cantonensis TaxID=2528202 RepID=A0A4V2NX83_9PROT|nr:hypothetical protein [Parasulfuritortus cantonensis]TCJ20242.1 hypothetical protein EZJ19_00695 [Parasulfuritortus cantonensis]